jgi:DNA polymerase/3'-5' exonuclease PolX
MSLFSTVQGIGPHRASELYEQGYRSLDQLGNSGRKREDHTFEYTEELKKRILRHKIDIFKQTIEYFIQGYDINFIIYGSYRRELETSKGIDIVFYGENVSYKGKELVHAMQHAGIILKVLSLGNDSFQGIAYLDEENKAVRVDFCFVNNPSELPYYLLYFTGSAQFNINIKTHARYYGFLLGNKEMLYNGVNICVNNEEDIFRTLGIKWVPHKERIDKLIYL